MPAADKKSSSPVDQPSAGSSGGGDKGDPATAVATNADGTAAAANGDEKPRLTDEEKKQNHIASEQKRRQAIREGFDRLTRLVPGLEGQGRSEGIVLQRTVEYLLVQLEERKRLVEAIEKQGGHVNDAYKEPFTWKDKDKQDGSENGRP